MTQPTLAGNVTFTLLPFALIVLLGYSALGLPLAQLPIQVHQAGYGPAVVGVVIGIGPVATLLTRQMAGALADRYGPKTMVVIGLVVTGLPAFAYLAALVLPGALGLAVLMLGRILLGLGDSLFTTGIMTWAITRAGPYHAGRAIGWIGIAMYAALAIGAPLGVTLGHLGGFAAVAIAAGVAPLLGIPVALAVPGVPGSRQQRLSFAGIVRTVWAQGLAVVLASTGLGTIAAFLALRYAAAGWPGAGFALTGFGIAYISSRLLFAGLPDRLGGVRVALPALAGEALGLVLIAEARQPLMALLATAIAGFGYAMVFPAMGVEAVRRVPVESRGTTMGAILACFDLGLGVGGPMGGLVAGWFGLPAAFLAAAVAALLSMALVWNTRWRGTRPA